MTFTVDIDENCKRFVQMKLSSRTLKERCIEEDRVRKKISVLVEFTYGNTYEEH